MTQLLNIRFVLRQYLAIFLPLGLWFSLWLSISPGNAREVFHPQSLTTFAHGIRAILPIAAACIGVILMLAKLSQGQPRGFRFISPLGLTTIYGLAGLVAVWQSPDGSTALWWTSLYLTVPLVLWGIVWGTDPLGQIRRLINLTWLFIVLVAVALFATAAIYLDLIDVLRDPSSLLDCTSGGWHNLTSGRLRSTGVGRYAAIAAIIAISGLWQRNWRAVSVFVLVTSVILLMFTGARGAFAGLAVGGSTALLLYGGKRALLGGAILLPILVLLLWTSGNLVTFKNQCLFRGWPPLISYVTVSEEAQPPSERPDQEQTPAIIPPTQQLTLANPPTSEAPVQTQITPQISPTVEAPEQTRVAPQNIPTVKAPGQTRVAPQNIPTVKAPGQTRVAPQNIPTVATPEQTRVAPQNIPTRQAPNLNQQVSAPPSSSPAGQPSKTKPENSSTTVQVITKRGFLQFTGRTAVWSEGLKLVKESPAFGFGFQADRLLLGAHMHNAFMHALIQTGLIGTIPFLAAILFAWFSLIKTLRKLSWLPDVQRHLFIQSSGVLAFLTVRGFPESTGAFFGIDWLILAPLLVYLHLISSSDALD